MSNNLFLYLTTLIYAGIRTGIKSHNQKNLVKKNRELQEKQKQLDIENQELSHASKIWRLVAHTNSEYIKGATVLLDFGIHDNDECLRFIQIPRNPDRTWHSGVIKHRISF